MTEVHAIIVTHNPDPDLTVRVAALEAQVNQVLIVDNGSRPEDKASLDSLADHPKVKILYNVENLGLAAALNQGVRWALAEGAQWIATFDQDSTVTPGFMPALLRAYEACPQREQVAIVTPLLRDTELGRLHSFTYFRYQDHELYSFVDMSITSGNLIPARVCKEMGAYREDFFIDYIDQEFSLRCRRRGWRILEASQAVLDHKYGRPTRHTFLWKHPVVTNHSAVRRYYQARNRLVV